MSVQIIFIEVLEKKHQSLGEGGPLFISLPFIHISHLSFHIYIYIYYTWLRTALSPRVHSFYSTVHLHSSFQPFKGWFVSAYAQQPFYSRFSGLPGLIEFPPYFFHLFLIALSSCVSVQTRYICFDILHHFHPKAFFLGLLPSTTITVHFLTLSSQA